MESPPASSDHGDVNFDPARPFHGIVVCCTSIPPEQRTDVASKTAELGGVHKYDLTPDVTHLIVGDYDTAKYRHVARERSDIKPMALGWVEAVRSLWTEDADIDFSALEKAWSLKPLETHGGEPATQSRRGVDRGKLLCCLTGFDDADERQRIIDKIHANGGNYTGDLTRQVTHLIVARPEGRKYTAAKTWNVHTVSVEWLDDSALRGMILDEKCYDPTLPKEDRGKNAWMRRDPRSSSLSKRLRDPSAAQEDGRRKLRKTASMKLNSQRDDLWGNILGKGLPSAGPNHAEVPRGAESRPDKALDPRQDARSSPGSDQTAASLAQPGPTSGLPFSSCSFFVHGFSKVQTEILLSTVSSHGGQSVYSLGDLANSMPGGIQHRLVIVPQNSSSETHPSVPEGAHLVTEFFIERCMHKKRFFSPGDDVIGRPFPAFPIPGFDKLGICTAGFTGVDLNQVDKAIRQLGARYEERFTAQTSILVCTSLETVRRQKLDLAIVWRVPVVKASWLWTCITTGSMLPIRSFMFPSLRQSDMAPWESEQGQKTQPVVWDQHVDPIPQPPKASPGNSAQDSRPTTEPKGHKDLSSHLQRFETAPTHQSDNQAPSEDRSRPSSRHSAPLSELSANNVNRSASPPKPPKTTRKSLSRMPSEIADSETAGDGESDDDRGSGEATQLRLEQQKVAADERLALSTRLTNLLEATPGGGTVRSGSESCTRDDVVGAGAAATAKPPRRKRGIMGRAISNVSAASSGSVDSAATATVATTASRTITAAAQLLIDQEIPDDPDKTKLSLTQVEYEAPDAQRYKAQLLSKMMGNGGSLPPEQRPEEKLTMRDYQQAIQAEKSYAAGSGATATRRTTRRRQ